MDDLKHLDRIILLAANLKHRGADLLDHFRKTGEICRMPWFPELEGGDLRIAFELAQRSVEQMIERRIAKGHHPEKLCDEQSQGHNFPTHRADHRIVHYRTPESWMEVAA